MKSLILHSNQTGPELTVYQTSNNMGDQVLLFKYEGQDTSYPNQLELSFPEGLWTEFESSNLISLWNINNMTPNRMNL